MHIHIYNVLYQFSISRKLLGLFVNVHYVIL